MHKKIEKVSKDVRNGDLKKAKKDLKSLKKADIKMDRKVDKMKKGKC